jgi:hypothetical protein
MPGVGFSLLRVDSTPHAANTTATNTEETRRARTNWHVIARPNVAVEARQPRPVARVARAAMKLIWKNGK